MNAQYLKMVVSNREQLENEGYILVNPGWETAEDRNRFERNYTKALETKDLQAALDFISYFITLGYTAFIHEYPGMPFQCYVVKSGFGKV